MTPLLKMHTLGHDFIPEPIHAGGLRYHGMSPLMSHVYELGLVEAVAKNQNECFAAGVHSRAPKGSSPLRNPPTRWLHASKRPGAAPKPVKNE